MNARKLLGFAAAALASSANAAVIISPVWEEFAGCSRQLPYRNHQSIGTFHAVRERGDRFRRLCQRALSAE